MTHPGPPDPNEMAFRIVQAATEEPEAVEEPARVVAGRKGGKARAAALTAEERAASARKAARARWQPGETDQAAQVVT
ncbi:MAG: hypothetical protein OXQ29_20695 [Rhodospirillaceae bacterium]|nr:hypothetical protein [Rhodospirillaceae bacterium]